MPRLDGAVEDSPLRFRLGEREYRRSELTWREAGCPRAEVALGAVGERLEIAVRVEKAELCFRPPDAPDPALDNEHPDIHSDGVQLHVLAPGWGDPASWLAVPEARGGRVRIRAVDCARDDVPVEASWIATPGGYAMRFSLPLAALGGGREPSFALDLIVNDMAPGRERRRGQLVLSGGAGEFVYLQGDRQPPSRYLRFRVERG